MLIAMSINIKLGEDHEANPVCHRPYRLHIRFLF